MNYFSLFNSIKGEVNTKKLQSLYLEIENTYKNWWIKEKIIMGIKNYLGIVDKGTNTC